ncbi:hypothetical protein HZU83_00735 [Sphaerotilus montanus]|uniref:Class I SAM-dependent methyltransferase n=1 Tax=Sphaerotilus montanus TaxID=522889 RepID=A0A7Y9QTX9_9BURK|nr:hypothetical protein [Sphaerotilus montanus]NYG31221.1 hypothetical protein [Sphaerotilus montanus]NZD55207.1 hypothetical protein [Sphaerotilus montanus]
MKIALDTLYKEATKTHGNDADKAITEQIKYLSKSYTQLSSNDREPVNYKDPATRFAYVYKYVASHGDYVVQVLEVLRQKLEGRIFKTDSIRVSCVGGGPGSDIIALLKYLDERKATEKVKKVTCYLLDREQAWADTWVELDDSLQTDLVLHANFQPLDVTKPESWAQQKKFLEADVFTMSYFVSEVMALDKDGVVTKFWEKLFKEAKPGAIFIYDDNGHDTFNRYFDKQWKAAKLNCLVEATNEDFWPRYNEQKSELGEFLKKFGQQPKLKTSLTYRVLQKP